MLRLVVNRTRLVFIDTQKGEYTAYVGRDMLLKVRADPGQIIGPKAVEMLRTDVPMFRAWYVDEPTDDDPKAA